jgi:hypothetical protein
MVDILSDTFKGKDPLGKWVQVTLKSGPSFQGLIFSHDIATGILILQEYLTSQKGNNHSKNSKYTIHILKLSNIQLVKLLESTPPTQNTSSNTLNSSAVQPLPFLVPLQSLPFDKLEAREQEAVRLEKEKQAKLGVGVTKEAQVSFSHPQTILIKHFLGHF